MRRFNLFLFGIFKGEEALTEVVEHNEQTHTHQHCHIFLNTYRHIGNNAGDQRLCYAVSQQVTDGYVGDKLDYIWLIYSALYEHRVVNRKMPFPFTETLLLLERIYAI